MYKLNKRFKKICTQVFYYTFNRSKPSVSVIEIFIYYFWRAHNKNLYGSFTGRRSTTLDYYYYYYYRRVNSRVTIVAIIFYYTYVGILLYNIHRVHYYYSIYAQARKSKLCHVVTCTMIIYNIMISSESFLRCLYSWILLTAVENNNSLRFAGTKTDLRLSQNDCVTRKKGKKMMKKIGAVKYLECSALTNEGLDTIFTESVRAAVKRPRQNCFAFPFTQCCKWERARRIHRRQLYPWDLVQVLCSVVMRIIHAHDIIINVTIWWNTAFRLLKLTFGNPKYVPYIYLYRSWIVRT